MGVRVLVVSSDTFPPTRVDVSVLFAKELAGRGHHFDWILQSEEACARAYVTPWGGGEAWVGATDLGQSLISRLRKHALGIVNDLRLVSRLRHNRYDAVEVKDKFLAGAVAAIACRFFRTPFIYWLSYPFPEDYLMRAKDPTSRYPKLYALRGRAFKWLLYRWLLPAADHVFVQSEQMREDIAARGISAQKMTAVPMGISAELCAIAGSCVPRLALPAGVPCVLYLGSLDKVRRLDFLLRVMVQVRTVVPDARLYLVGRGVRAQDEELLKQEAIRLGLQSSVVFVGQLPQPEAMRYTMEADVCVSPLYPTPVFRVASPTKLIEYLALGKAVVANDHPEQKRVIEESGAGLCVPYEEESFANAVVKLLEDPQAARTMGERGRRYALERRSYGVIADVVERRMLEIAAHPC